MSFPFFLFPEFFIFFIFPPSPPLPSALRMATSSTSCPFPSCGVVLASAPALHQHMNSHLRADRDRSAESEFVAYLHRFGRRICPGGCRQTLSISTATHPKCKGCGPPLPSVPSLHLVRVSSPVVASPPSLLGGSTTSPVASSPVIAPPSSSTSLANARVLPSLPRVEDIFAADIPTLKRIPLSISNLCSSALSKVFLGCVSSGSSLEPWTLLFLFPKVVLRWSAKRGGVKRGKSRATKLGAVLRARLDRWEGGEYKTLWAEALADARNRREDPSSSTSRANNVRRAIRCAEDGRYAKAVAALLSLGTCSPTDKAAIAAMMEKHPAAPAPLLPVGPPPPLVVFPSEIVKGRLQSFPNSSGAGGSGFRPQYFKDIVACPNTFVAGESLESLTSLVNCVAAGKAPRVIAPFLSGAPLIALNKKGGGLRPIAIGESLRRLVSKCCCFASADDAKSFFGSLQVGVATIEGWKLRFMR